jgi:hypothetical protein
VAWNKYGTPTINIGILSPDGTNNAFELNMAVGQGIYQNATNTAGTYACSIYIKGDTNGIIGLIDGNSLPTQTVNVTTEWKRVNVVLTKGVSPLQYAIYRLDSSYLSKVYIYGAQCENGSYPTSYIPTTSASVTRNADVVSKTGISSLIGQTEGTVFFDIRLDTISAQTNDPVLWYMKDGGTGERYVELFDNGNLTYTEFNGAVIANITKSGLTVGRHKYAIAYANNDMTFYVDGVQIGTDTSGTPSGFSEFGLQYYNTAFYGQQKVNAIALWKTRLTNTQLSQLTTI